jgi:hypothetical protein
MYVPFSGFTGSACQRSKNFRHWRSCRFISLLIVSCPKDCSGHGTCSTIRDISVYVGPDYDSRAQQAGDGYGIPYTNWDGNSIQLCECDEGYFGTDCSLGL